MTRLLEHEKPRMLTNDGEHNHLSNVFFQKNQQPLENTKPGGLYKSFAKNKTLEKPKPAFEHSENMSKNTRLEHEKLNLFVQSRRVYTTNSLYRVMVSRMRQPLWFSRGRTPPALRPECSVAALAKDKPGVMPTPTWNADGIHSVKDENKKHMSFLGGSICVQPSILLFSTPPAFFNPTC